MSGNKSLGKGGALLGAAKLYFLVASYATVLALTHLLDPAIFGSYSAVGRLIAVPNMVIIYTLMFTVSRPLAAEFASDCPSYVAIRRRGFRMAASLGGVVSVVFFVGAPWFANALSEPSLVWPIRVVAPISLIYALYAVNVGTLNARRLFSRQAGLDMLMATTKAALIIAAAALGLGLGATLGGFTLAALVALTISVWWVRAARPTRVASQRAAPMARLAGALVLFTTATHLLLSTDLFVLKHFAIDDGAKAAVGFYSGAQYIAQVPYSLLNAVSLLMFPLIASLDAEGDHGKVRDYVAKTIEVSVLLLALMATVAVAAAPGVMRLLFPPAYQAVTEELRLIVTGYSGYALVVTSSWILNSCQRSRTALLLVAACLATSATIAFVLTPELGARGVAIAVVSAGAVGTVAALFALRVHFGATLALGWLLRLAALCALVVWLGANWSPSGKLLILVQLVALTVVFLGGAWATRLFSMADLQRLRQRSAAP